MSAEEARAKDAKAWTAFLERSKDEAQVASEDIPWPSAGDEDPLALKLSLQGAAPLSQGERRVAVRDLQRRWHPDKFAQRFGSKLGDASEGIMARITRISQALNAALTGS